MLPASTTSAIYSMSHKDISDLKSEVPEFKFKHTIFLIFSQKLFYPCLHFKLEVGGMTKILYTVQRFVFCFVKINTFIEQGCIKCQ